MIRLLKLPVRCLSSRWMLLRTWKTQYFIFGVFMFISMTTIFYRDNATVLNTEDCTLSNISITLGNSILYFGDACLYLKLYSFNRKTTVLNIYMGLQLTGKPPKLKSGQNNYTLHYDVCNLTISLIKAEDCDKYSVNWNCKEHLTITNAVSLKGSHWYGGTVTTKQLWPIEKWQHPVEAYVTHDSFQGQYGGMMERYWLSSSGVALVAADDVPLFVGFTDDRNLILQSKWVKPFTNLKEKPISLNYLIYQSGDIMTVHKIASTETFARPYIIPNENLFRYPIWSTWMAFKTEVSQIKVLKFAQDILEHGFKVSQLEIDDKWCKSYGDFEWDPCKFPQPKEMIQQLKNMNIPVTLWVHPFASVFSKSSSLNIWVKRGGFLRPDFCIWWEGFGYALDVTNPQAIVWFLTNLNNFKNTYGIHSFKFDGGETTWLPSNPVFFEPLQDINDYTRIYAQLAAVADPRVRAQEVRVGVRTQHLPMVIRLMDKNAWWSIENGLQTIIPNVLTYSVLGYAFVLPDLIGGNSYFIDQPPTKELYIRWAQLSTFLPVMQFSLPPWHYDEETINITRQLTQLHEKHSDLLIELAKNFVSTGDPIIRPLWWIAAKDETALTIDSEFLVGNNLLVAPVLHEGALSRDVYLPPGRWRDMRGAYYNGGRWHYRYKASIHELPYFRRLH